MLLYIQFVHRRSVRTSQGTQPLYDINTDLLMLFREIISVYPDNFTTHINTTPPLPRDTSVALPSHSGSWPPLMGLRYVSAGHTTRGRTPLDE
jgi:hypothetical protein